MPLLVVVRHAKAADPAAGGADVNRPLRARGVADARAAGSWLRGTIGTPDRVICSPARRALETAEELIAAWALPGPERAPQPGRERASPASAGSMVLDVRPEIYESSVGDLLAVVAQVDGAADPVVLVGHNPSVSGLVAALSGEAVSLRTCGVAILQWDGPWADVRAGCGRLLCVNTPRAG